MPEISPADLLAKLLEADWFRRIHDEWPEELKKHSEPLSPMDKRAFTTFVKSLTESKGEIADYADFEQKLAMALADKKEFPQRMKKIVSRIFDILIYDLAPSEDKEKAEKLGGALVNILMTLSLSSSLDEVRVKRGEKNDVCVLVFGFAGSHVDEIQPQVEFYASCGFSTISTSRCVYPHTHHFRQILAVGQALQEILTEGSKVIVHVCSGGGGTFWAELAFRWFAGLAPFDKLPPLPTVVKGLVCECTPVAYANAKTGEAVVPKHAPFYEASGGEAINGSSGGLYNSAFQDSFLTFTTLGSISNLCTFYCPDVNMHRLASTTPGIMSFIRHAGRSEGYYYTLESMPPGYCPQNFDTMWDCSGFDIAWGSIDVFQFEPPVPRLFLYTAKDIVITPESVELHIKHVQKYWPEATNIFVHKCKEALHCHLWDSPEREDCVKVTTELLKAAGVLT